MKIFWLSFLTLGVIRAEPQQTKNPVSAIQSVTVSTKISSVTHTITTAIQATSTMILLMSTNSFPTESAASPTSVTWSTPVGASASQDSNTSKPLGSYLIAIIAVVSFIAFCGGLFILYKALAKKVNNDEFSGIMKEANQSRGSRSRPAYRSASRAGSTFGGQSCGSTTYSDGMSNSEVEAVYGDYPYRSNNRNRSISSDMHSLSSYGKASPNRGLPFAAIRTMSDIGVTRPTVNRLNHTAQTVIHHPQYSSHSTLNHE